jgi:prevent-host-death family protein
MNVQATELKNRLGKYLDAAIKEPVIVEKNGRNAAVIISFEEYNHLLELEDFYWGIKALEAEKEQSLENGLEVLTNIVKEKGIALDGK